MNKKIGLCLTIIALVLCMLIPVKSVYAAEKKVTNLEVTQSNNKISVKGKTESGVLAVAIAVYNEKGTELITMQTTSVNSDNEFSDTIAQKEGNYLIKVADYEGGPYAEESLTVKEEDKTEEKTETEEEKTEQTTEESKTDETKTETENKETEKSSNPKTGDNILIAIVIFAIATLGLFATIKINKNSKTKKH